MWIACSTAKGNNGCGQQFWVNVNEGLISLDVTKARITDLIREIAYHASTSSAEVVRQGQLDFSLLDAGTSGVTVG